MSAKITPEIEAKINNFLRNQLFLNDNEGISSLNLVYSEIDLAKQIYELVVNPKFRKTAIDLNTKNDTIKKIENNLELDLPIEFSLPFGAYKNWKAWSYPEPEWAEVFNVNYMIRYITPIAKIYKPGVVLNYSYGNNVMDIVSNMPPNDTQKYINSFETILSYFQKKVIKNIKLNAICINQFYYNQNEHRKELFENFEFNAKNWQKKYTDDIRKKKLDSARRNFMLKGVQDFSLLSYEELEQKYLESAMWCDAHDCLTERRKFNKYSTNIEIANIRGPSLALNIGSCDTSTLHFWVGCGVIEIKKNKYLQRILSQISLEKLIINEEIEFFKTKNDLTNISSIFNKIPVWVN